jgi:hypothetical protein
MCGRAVDVFDDGRERGADQPETGKGRALNPPHAQTALYHQAGPPPIMHLPSLLVHPNFDNEKPTKKLIELSKAK